MSMMQRFRHAGRFARFMLAWFALSLGVAIASPAVNPQGMELVCSGSGAMKMLVKNADGSTSEASARMADCPLCATAAAPPPAASARIQPVQALGHAVQPIPAAHIAAAVSAPLPARGPPAFL
jgi:Protein of unknown function (DUF2946)